MEVAVEAASPRPPENTWGTSCPLGVWHVKPQPSLASDLEDEHNAGGLTCHLPLRGYYTVSPSTSLCSPLELQLQHHPRSSSESGAGRSFWLCMPPVSFVAEALLLIRSPHDPDMSSLPDCSSMGKEQWAQRQWALSTSTL